jgi:hypothetical protein
MGRKPTALYYWIMHTTGSSLTYSGQQNLYVALFAVLIAFGIYRRFRRNFGAQALRPVAMGIRIGLLAVVGLALLPLWQRSLGFAAAGAAGAILGLGLGAFAALRTRFESRANGIYYIPHTYTGLIVFTLFLGRLIYRVGELYLAGDLGAAQPPSRMVQTPLTLGLLYVLIAYYVFYLSRVLWKSRHLGPGDLEPGAEITTAP